MASQKMTLENFLKEGDVACFACNESNAQKGSFQGLRQALSQGGEALSDEMKTMFRKWTKAQPNKLKNSQTER